MKRFISFILGFVLFTILGFHNSVMAFGGDISMSMGNHSNMVITDIQSESPECHDGEEFSLSNCESICCFDKEGSSSTSSLAPQNNKKKFDKLKYVFYELSFDKSFIYELNLFGNISPPDREKNINTYSYISLIGSVKSTT